MDLADEIVRLRSKFAGLNLTDNLERTVAILVSRVSYIAQGHHVVPGSHARELRDASIPALGPVTCG